MLNNQQLINLITVGLLLVGAESAIAQSTSNSSASTDNPKTEVLFKPPPNDKKPDRTSGAGSRHDWQCLQDSTSHATTDTPSNKPSLMALVPTTNHGLTLAERPTFWVYLPKTSAKQVVLSLREEGTQHHSQTFFPITGAPGIISIKPSDDSPALEVGKNYQWAVVLVCGEWRKMSATRKGELLYKLADLMEQNKEAMARLETLDNGKPLLDSLNMDVPFAIACYRYYAGWADKIQGKTIPINGPNFLLYPA